MDIQRSKLHYAARDIVKSNLNFLVDSHLSTSDLEDTRNKSLIRLKVAVYTYGQEFNMVQRIVNKMFIETINVDITKQSGGPFQAYELGNKFFYYLYFNNKVLAVMNLSENTIKKLKQITSKYKDFHQSNSGYYTIGKVIPVSEIYNTLGNDFGLYQLQ